MNRRLITYNCLKPIANGSIHFHAFSYQYPGSGYRIEDSHFESPQFVFYDSSWELSDMLKDKVKCFAVSFRPELVYVEYYF